MTVRRGFFDCDGRLLREIDESERHAFSAVSGQVAKQHTCLVAKNGGKPEPLGSGTFVQVGEGGCPRTRESGAIIAPPVLGHP